MFVATHANSSSTPERRFVANFGTCTRTFRPTKVAVTSPPPPLPPPTYGRETLNRNKSPTLHLVVSIISVGSSKYISVPVADDNVTFFCSIYVFFRLKSLFNLIRLMHQWIIDIVNRKIKKIFVLYFSINNIINSVIFSH